MQEQAWRVADPITWLRMLLLPVTWVYALLGDGRVVGASARRLIVFCAGSYPGVIRPATRTTGKDRSGALVPRAALTRLIGQR